MKIVDRPALLHGLSVSDYMFTIEHLDNENRLLDERLDRLVSPSDKLYVLWVKLAGSPVPPLSKELRK